MQFKLDTDFENELSMRKALSRGKECLSILHGMNLFRDWDIPGQVVGIYHASFDVLVFYQVLEKIP
jgi:hypothetical protein